jgi:hypothetical protein
MPKGTKKKAAGCGREATISQRPREGDITVRAFAMGAIDCHSAGFRQGFPDVSQR